FVAQIARLLALARLGLEAADRACGDTARVAQRGDARRGRRNHALRAELEHAEEISPVEERDGDRRLDARALRCRRAAGGPEVGDIRDVDDVALLHHGAYERVAFAVHAPFARHAELFERLADPHRAPAAPLDGVVRQI